MFDWPLGLNVGALAATAIITFTGSKLSYVADVAIVAVAG